MTDWPGRLDGAISGDGVGVPNVKSVATPPAAGKTGTTETASRTMPNALLGASVDTKSSSVVAPVAVKEACPLSYDSTAGEKAGTGAGP